ncbi:hypothetical protein MMC11_003334 [Xylographa trunciseda]|nr:hypothetical protein [Xylographa trunciseda]
MAQDAPQSPPRKAPTSGFRLVESPYLLEEQAFSWYKPENYYHVRIGEVFHSRYQVLGKLGYGSVSTAWLCRDLQKHKYVTLKVYAYGHRQAENEEKVLAHIATVDQAHEGSRFIRKLLDSFEVRGKKGPHRCLIHKPLIMTLKDLGCLLPDGKMSLGILRPIVRYLLYALDFLHAKAKVVHTDIQGGNIMMSIIDQSTLKTFEDEEWAEPSARKIDGDRIIYTSRALDIPDDPGVFVLCDFGDARFGAAEYSGEVMPDLYRAPELVLRIPWNEKIDIWSVGMLIWGLVEGKEMFHDRLPSREQSIGSHLARMIALLGPPPKDLLERGILTKHFFDEHGIFIASKDIANTSLEVEEETLEGEEKVEFLRFLRRMLCWRPQDRASAGELLKDPWMRK